MDFEQLLQRIPDYHNGAMQRVMIDNLRKIGKKMSANKDRPSTPAEQFYVIDARSGQRIKWSSIRCKGGPLAWPPLSVLQDQLRMEQVDAREKILRDDLRAGNELPSLSVALKDATAVVKLLGEPSVPAWLRERAR